MVRIENIKLRQFINCLGRTQKSTHCSRFLSVKKQKETQTSTDYAVEICYHGSVSNMVRGKRNGQAFSTIGFEEGYDSK